MTEANNTTNTINTLIDEMFDEMIDEDALETKVETAEEQPDPDSDDAAPNMTLFDEASEEELVALLTAQGSQVADNTDAVDQHCEVFAKFYYETMVEKGDADLIRIEWLDMMHTNVTRQGNFLRELCQLAGVPHSTTNGVKVYNRLVTYLIEKELLEGNESILLQAAENHDEFVAMGCKHIVDTMIGNAAYFYEQLETETPPHKFIVDTRDDITSPMAVYDMLCTLCEQNRCAISIVDGISYYNAYVEGFIAIGFPDVDNRCYLDRHHDGKLLAATAQEWAFIDNMLGHMSYAQRPIFEEMVSLDKMDTPEANERLAELITDRAFCYIDYANSDVQTNVRDIFKSLKMGWEAAYAKAELEQASDSLNLPLESYLIYGLYSAIIEENNHLTQYPDYYRLTDTERRLLQDISEKAEDLFRLHFDARVDDRLQRDLEYRREQKSELGKLKARRMSKQTEAPVDDPAADMGVPTMVELTAAIHSVVADQANETK